MIIPAKGIAATAALYTRKHSAILRRCSAVFAAAALLVAVEPTAPVTSLIHAQAPMAGGFTGRSVEAHALYQTVSNDYGDWSGIYARAVFPAARQTLFADVLALRAFGEQGIQGGLAHRYDWTDRWFHLLGGSVGDGAPIFPRYRADGLIGRKWGESRAVQTVLGASVVQSVEDLRDKAVIGAITWYAPHNLVLESGIRYNTSSPGSIKSHRIHGLAMYTPSDRRTFSARFIGGTEGWQILNVSTTLTHFASQEAALAWRERLGASTALSLQLDMYHNPYYTRSGVTLGVARYW